MGTRLERRRAVRLMWEYGCAHSPVWACSDDLDVGPIDVVELGVEPLLRDDLAAWNEAIEVAADPNDEHPGDWYGDDWWHARAVAAFELAERLQRSLGAEWTVWCTGTGGPGGLEGDALRTFRVRDGRALLLLHEAALALMSPPSTRYAPLELPGALRRAVRDWGALHDRVAQPGSEGPGTVDPLDRRLHGLQLAGRLQHALPNAVLLWFGGEDVRRG